MAKKQAANKTQAVRDYLKAHRNAMSSEIVKALAKEGVKLTPAHAANIKSKLMRTQRAKKAEAVKPVVEVSAAAETSSTKPAASVTLDQIKSVGQMVKTIGGFRQLHEMLAVIKEVGGTKKFKDLLEAMAVIENEVSIPF